MTTLGELWQAIQNVGSIDRYIEQQLREKGYLVSRKDTDSLSKRELKRYKESLKKEAEEKKKLKKITWQAYKQQHIVYLGERVYWNDQADCDKWDIENAQTRLLENRLPKITNVNQFAEALTISVSELRWLCYHRDAATQTHYQRFTIPKRSGGERAIWAPKPKLKQVQRWVLKEILEHLWVHGSAHGFLPGRSIASNAEIHKNSKLLVKLDIENFFPSVSWRRVKGIFRKAGYQEQIATLLALLCTESPREMVQHQNKIYYIALAERCLPQGAPTSPALTNILCLRLDRRLTGLANALGWRYSRYADDMSFSLPIADKKQPELKTLLGSIKRIVGAEGFTIHPQKTRVIRPGNQQQVTGLIVNGPQAPRVPRNLKRQLRAAIHNLQQGKGLREGESIERLKGYAAYITMTEAQLGRKMLAALQAF